MPNSEMVRRFAASRYAGVVVLGVLVAAAFGTGIALAQSKPAPHRPATAPATRPSPADAQPRPPDGGVPPALAEDGARAKPAKSPVPKRAVKAPPPYAAAFDGTPPPAHQTTAAPTTTSRPPVSPPPALPENHDPADN
jgi:hypothetical protein